MPAHVYDAGFVSPWDGGYRTRMHDMAALHQGIRKGTRAAGEVLGGHVERAVRHCLSKQIPLQPERILRWKQMDRSGRYTTRYRELDAVERLDEKMLCLFEIKLTNVQRMVRGEGLRQLRKSKEILLLSQQFRRVCRRLVYVSDAPVKIKGGLPVVDVKDTECEEAVIWFSPENIESAANELDIILPENWLDPAARIGGIAAEEQEWEPYVEKPQSRMPLSNSLADAFRRAAQHS